MTTEISYVVIDGSPGTYDVVCSFPTGIPGAETGKTISLTLYPEGLDSPEKIIVIQNDVTFTNTLKFWSFEFDAECSWAGGCTATEYGYTGAGSLLGRSLDIYSIN